MAADPVHDPEFTDVVPKPTPRRSTRLGRILSFLWIMAIGSVLVALFLPATRRVPGPVVRRLQCSNNLKQVALALLNYEHTYGMLPPAYTEDAAGRPLHSWRTLILPFLDQRELYDSIDLAKPWDDPANAEALRTVVSVYHCTESLEARDTTTYLAVVAPGGCFLPAQPRRLVDVMDAHESTLMLIDAGDENAVPWMATVDAGESLVMRLGLGPYPNHRGGTNACFVGGNVRFLDSETTPAARRSMISISGRDDPGIE